MAEEAFRLLRAALQRIGERRARSKRLRVNLFLPLAYSAGLRQFERKSNEQVTNELNLHALKRACDQRSSAWELPLVLLEKLP